MVAFCHNGGIQTFMDEAIETGVSDSKLFMKHMSNRLKRIDSDHLAEMLTNCADEWSYTSLNSLLLLDGALYAWRCFTTDTSKRAEFERYYTIYAQNRNEKISVATEPVDSSDDWSSIPNRTLVSIERNDTELVMNQIKF